jgi:5-formyltetrahydrofolate cyclo-ligase
MALIAAGKKLLLPKLLPDKDLAWILWDGHQKSLERNGKILEPTGEKFIQESEIDAVIVPALCIDRHGSRLGQGGGSYDRALARLDSQRCWRIGLVRSDELISEKIPTDLHDQKLNAAATPDLIARFAPN